MKIQFTLDTLIALIALAASIYSIFRTNWLDRYSLEVSSFESELSNGEILFGYSVINTSTRVLKVTDLKMYLKGKELKPLNIDRQTDVYQSAIFHQINSSNILDECIYFKKPTILLPGSSFQISVYLKHDPDTIELTADHRIKGFKKTKLFPVNHLNLNDMNNVQN